MHAHAHALALLLVATTATPPALAAAPAPPSAPSLALVVRREKLDNGLRVVLAVDHTSKTVAVDVMYDVGARSEERGRSGFAHLFEHMMFQGSGSVARSEHGSFVSARGGTCDGNTTSDRTNYFEVLPSAELPLALWLEADRMRSLDVSQRNLDNQRQVVREEYRMRVENAAYAPAFWRLRELIFQGYWPYEHATIGTMKDVDAAELSWVRAFHAAYYGPNAAVLAISGDFEPAEALALVRRYLGDVPSLAATPPYAPGPVPEQTAPRDAVMVDAHAKLPDLLLGWAVPGARDAEHDALEVAARILVDGEASRLRRLLVRERGLAIELDDRPLLGLYDRDAFILDAKLARGARVDLVERLVAGELAQLGKAGPSDEEMTRARARFESSFLLGLQSNYARARKLAELELFAGDATLVNRELARIVAVEKEDVRRVVAKYLTPARASRVEVKPPRDGK